MRTEDYFRDNAANWDDRARLHEESGYGIDELVADPGAITPFVRLDMPYLPDLRGLRVCHLQCHLGTDSISLARLGADVVGVDLSQESLRRARLLAARCGVEDRVSFVESNVYDARKAVEGEFDLVYTTLGVLCWLPEVAGWARVIESLLRPGGQVFVRDDHPMLMTIDDDVSNGFRVSYPYFEAATPLTWDDTSSYIETGEGADELSATTSHQWNHSIGEILSAILDAGLRIDGFEETQAAAWLVFQDLMEETAEGYRLREAPERLPMQFILRASKV